MVFNPRSIKKCRICYLNQGVEYQGPVGLRPHWLTFLCLMGTCLVNVADV